MQHTNPPTQTRIHPHIHYTTHTLPTLTIDAIAASHVLLLRAGFIRQLGNGLFITLPLAQRVMDKIEAVIDDELQQAGEL